MGSVAVAEMTFPLGTPTLVKAIVNVTEPEELVVTLVDPIKLWPWVPPDGLAKYSMRYCVLAALRNLPTMVVPLGLVDVPVTADVRLGAAWPLFALLFREMPELVFP